MLESEAYPTSTKKLYAHPVANWPFPQWLPYPYKAPKEVKVYPDSLF